MDFSTIAFCSENKRRIDFRTFLSSEKLINQSSNMGIHQSEGIPFVELTGNKMEEPIVHSPFQFDLAKSLGLTSKIHSLANNTKNNMKDTYNHQFSAIAFSPLVGGFVGSKSQVGSSSREACQIWDVVLEKLAEFCGGSQSEYHPLFADNYSQTCYNLGKKISQGFLGSLCQKSASTVDTSKTTVGNYSSKLPEKITETMPRSHTAKTVPIPQSIASSTNCMGTPSSGVVSCPPDLSKQSYAEVAKTFAVAQQNKQQSTRTSTMHKAKNSGHRDRENKHKRRPRTSSSKDNWRYSRDSLINDCKNQGRMGLNNNRTNYSNRNNKFVTNMRKESKAEKNKSNTDITESQAQRIDKKNMQNMKRNPVQSVSKEPSMHISNKKTNKGRSQTVDSCFMYDNYNITSMKDESSVKPCISSNRNRSVDEVDDCAVFACKVEVSSIPLLIHAAENVQVSPKDTASYKSSEESSPRSRFSSECSTDSDDSFVIFESNVECDAVFVTLMRPPSVSDSEISEDGIVFELSSDEESEDDEDDDYDTETITEINEVNEKWRRNYSNYSGCERSPVKVHFASDSSLKTVHHMVVWNHAYRAARRGPWEQFVRDRDRFTSRIRQMESVLAPVLCTDHRRRMWKERFADDSSNLRSQVT